MPKKEVSHLLLRPSQAAAHVGVTTATMETRYRHLHILHTPGTDRRLSLLYLQGAERFAEAAERRYKGDGYADFGKTEYARRLVAVGELWLSTAIGRYAVLLPEEPDETYVRAEDVTSILNVSSATITAWEEGGSIEVHRHKRRLYIAQAALLGAEGTLGWQRPAFMPGFDAPAMSVPPQDAQG